MTTYKCTYWDDVNEGDEIPQHDQEITRYTVVATAIATRDFYPVHHDHEFAHRTGAKDIFINIMTSNGFAGKYLTNWSGPEGVLKKMAIRLGQSGYVGETLVHTGKVVKKYTAGDEHLVDLEFTLMVSAGFHALGTATMSLPTKG